jgi:pyruvate dehydrogenase E2 component (dihydrolipoamide acetyltransferase)
MEFESFNEGTLLYIGIQEGNAAPVDSLLAIIGPEGTDISGIADNYKAKGSDELQSKKNLKQRQKKKKKKK